VSISKQDKRVVEFPYSGEKESMLLEETAQLIIVPVHEELAAVVLAVLFGAPVPTMVIPIWLGTVMPVVQLQEPAGI
jgi:hypothetical protein